MNNLANSFCIKQGGLTMPFSVVIPLYNKEQYIARAIRSVLGQTIPTFELIVVDDGSSDNSVEVVKRFSDSRIQLIQQEHAGVSAARNRGVAHASYDYIAFLDADDQWKPKFLATIQALSEEFPLAGLYMTSYKLVGSTDHSIAPRYPQLPKQGVVDEYFCIVDQHETIGLISSSVCVPKRVFAQIGGFQEGLHFAEDAFFWLKIALHYDVVFSDAVMSIVHREPEGGSSPIGKNRCYDSLDHFLSKNPLKYFEEHLESLNNDPKASKCLSNIIVRSLIDLAIVHIIHDKASLAEAILTHANQIKEVDHQMIRNRLFVFCHAVMQKNKPALRSLLASLYMKRGGLKKMFYQSSLVVPKPILFCALKGYLTLKKRL
jgi:glycosyltransferase involved in cell wall biosynthesis